MTLDWALRAAGLGECICKVFGDVCGRQEVRRRFSVVRRRVFRGVGLVQHRLDVRLGVDYVRLRREGAERSPDVAWVVLPVVIVPDAEIVAVAHDEVFVVVRVRIGVDCGARRVERRKVEVDLRVPAVGHIAGAVLVPARARIEAEGRFNLVVYEDVGSVDEQGSLGDRVRAAPKHQIAVSVGILVVEHRVAPVPDGGNRNWRSVGLKTVEVGGAGGVQLLRGDQRRCQRDVADRDRAHRRITKHSKRIAVVVGFVFIDRIAHIAIGVEVIVERIVVVAVGVFWTDRMDVEAIRIVVLLHGIHLNLPCLVIAGFAEFLAKVEHVCGGGVGVGVRYLCGHIETETQVRHEVAVGVADLRAVQRVERMQNLPAVAHVVAVAIPVAGVRADDKLLHVSEAVAVEVGVEAVHGHIELDARVEALKNVLVRNLNAPDDVVRVEALEDEELPVPLLAEIGPLGAICCRRSPDLGLVPEEVLPAVGHAVDIRV